MPNSKEFPARVTGSQQRDCGDTKLTWWLSHCVPRLDNTEMMSCIWEARLTEQRAIHWWYRWEQSAEAPGNLHMLTQLVAHNQWETFVVQGQSKLLIFIQLLVRLKSKVSFHWFFFWSSGVSPSLWKRGHILYLVCTNRSYCSSAKSGSRFTSSVTDGETGKLRSQMCDGWVLSSVGAD